MATNDAVTSPEQRGGRLSSRKGRTTQQRRQFCLELKMATWDALRRQPMMLLGIAGQKVLRRDVCRPKLTQLHQNPVKNKQ